MTRSTAEPGNPLRMISVDGTFVLPETWGSDRREGHLRRNHQVLAAHAVLSYYSSMGNDLLEQMEGKGSLTRATPMRVVGDERTIVANYGALRDAYLKGRTQLANQAFLMLYGSLEAYLFEIVKDALLAEGADEPDQEALDLLVMRKWQGKISKISQRFCLSMGHRIRRREFSNFPMVFLGKRCIDPIDFVQGMADLRHRLTHGAERVDAVLLREYPHGGLHEGELISLPYTMPFDVYYFLFALSEMIDRIFCNRYGWPRYRMAPERLI